MLTLIVNWTKLFWIDVILYKNKTSQGTSIIFFSFEVYQIPHVGKYFPVDHAGRTCITTYPDIVTKSQRYAKSHVDKWGTTRSLYYRGSFLKKIYENFVGTLETVHNIEVSVLEKCLYREV